jgi:paxillin
MTRDELSTSTITIPSTYQPPFFDPLFLDKYLKNLPSSPTGQNPPQQNNPIAKETPPVSPVSPYGSERRTPPNGLRGPRPPIISNPRSSTTSSPPPPPTIDQVKADLSYPFERKLNISDDTSSVAKSAQDLKNAVGIINKPPPPAVKTKPTNLSRSSSSSNDAFQSSLSRGKPLPPASVAAPPPPKVSVPVPAPPSISMPASKPTIATPATPSVSSNDEKVSVPNPLYASIRCGGCQKAISGVVINAMGKRWHANCFNCKQCGENLEHMAFFEKDGFPYCGLDYHEQFSLRCDYCNTPIEEASEYDMEESRTRMIVLTVCL